MSDCGPGFSVAVTRQHAPSSAYGFAAPAAPPARPAGGVNSTGATVCAIVTVPPRSVSDVNCSHVAATARVGSKTPNTITNGASEVIFGMRHMVTPLAAGEVHRTRMVPLED